MLVGRVQDVSENSPSLTYPIHDLHVVRHSQRPSGALKHNSPSKHNSEVQKKLKQEVGSLCFCLQQNRMPVWCNPHPFNFGSTPNSNWNAKNENRFIWMMQCGGTFTPLFSFLLDIFCPILPVPSRPYSHAFPFLSLFGPSLFSTAVQFIVASTDWSLISILLHTFLWICVQSANRSASGAVDMKRFNATNFRSWFVCHNAKSSHSQNPPSLGLRKDLGRVCEAVSRTSATSALWCRTRILRYFGSYWSSRSPCTVLWFPLSWRCITLELSHAFNVQTSRHS